MGIFRSHCIRCGSSIDWFITPPKNYYCNNKVQFCTQYNSPEWINLSHALTRTYIEQTPNTLENVQNVFNIYVNSLKSLTKSPKISRPPKVEGPDLIYYK